MDFDIEKYCEDLSSIHSELDFERIALKAFEFQYKNNQVYGEYCRYLKTNPHKVNKMENIPFMPVSFFKSHKVVSTSKQSDVIFTSSSTTGQIPSKHYVADSNIYKLAFLSGFQNFYGNPENYCILGLLPAYLERSGSSLVYMVDTLIKLSNNKMSGFFLHNHSELNDRIIQLEQQNKKYIVIGVSFALLDFAEKFHPNIKNGIVMETGGMKGKRKELVREELHKILKNNFGLQSIHSEYGMTELLSQAYSFGEGIYHCSKTMSVLVRETNDPLSVNKIGSGAINVIDLANIFSCCFLQTSDLGKINEDKSFFVLGRFDNSELRGCNLMIV